MRGVDEIGDELYGLPPQAFTAARDAYVAEAKSSGDRTAAAQVAAMKRPSVAAWLVNLVALRQPEAVERLLDLGETIRQAQGNVPPAQLRDLSAQRRKEIDATLAQARTLAAALGEAAPAKQHLSDVEATLAAAMADADAARLVRSGRVLKALSYSGFGLSGGAGPPPVTPPAPTRPPATSADEDTHRAEAATRIADAEAGLAEARRALAEAVEAEDAGSRAAQRLTEQIAELRDRLDGVQHEARAARQARLAAERELASAERRLLKATAARV